ncbi:hypothetical protein BC833DRAFT_583225 [Globomyces pollinis-pini]|nr:hypothetical protein BC833DRAFT_583225 [Globomyces pollinis-pini]KAJ2998914.1 exosome non-catalytic core subunit rrp4 [Globomyces sp. JEL0801]
MTLTIIPLERHEPMAVDSDASIVTPGQSLTKDLAFMRGHGTFTLNDSLVASVAGTLQRVNKLLSVKPLKTRFNGEIGDVVVGRIIELQQRKWKVDIKGRHDASLLLSSINLPGGVQRRKTESDELEMRTFFSEGDLLSAEVQAFHSDGSVSIHTRNIKYGKLRNGCLVTVPSALVKRSKSHFITLPCGVDVVLGLNGYIWCSKHVYISPEMANQPEGLYSNENEDISSIEREAIARVCNCITILANQKLSIYETIIVYLYEVSLDYSCFEILDINNQRHLVELALAKIEAVQDI